jgi:hypothetical protein
LNTNDLELSVIVTAETAEESEGCLPAPLGHSNVVKASRAQRKEGESRRVTTDASYIISRPKNM